MEKDVKVLLQKESESWNQMSGFVRDCMRKFSMVLSGTGKNDMNKQALETRQSYHFINIGMNFLDFITLKQQKNVDWH